MTTFVIVPGYVRSKYDKDRHYISARALMRLYGVAPSQCVVAPEGPAAEWWEPPEDAVYLRPNRDGDYVLPLQR